MERIAVLPLSFSDLNEFTVFCLLCIGVLMFICWNWFGDGKPQQLMLFVIGALFLAALAPAKAEPNADRGYWWYEAPVETAEPAVTAPEIPAPAALAEMHPDDVSDLIDAQLDYAVTVQTVEAVTDYYELIDFARRRSRAFSALASLALLESPELNPRTDYPTTNPGRIALNARREKERMSRLYQERQEFALIMLSMKNCTYCLAQWQVLQEFAAKTGWTVRSADIQEDPGKAARFGVGAAPVTVMIRRGTDQWANVAVGAESLPAIEETVYRSIRLMRGEIDPSQFFNSVGDDGGFFDPGAGR